MPRIDVIEGIGPVYREKLRQAGIATTEALLRQCATRQGRKALAEKTGIQEALLLNWANHADLFRIKGIGPQYAELLERAGVNTLPELAQRNPENLYKALLETNTKHKLVRRVPTLEMVRAWVEQAKILPRVLEY